MGEVWRLDREIPRLNFCGNTSQYSHEYIEQEIRQLQANLPGIFAAATAWRHGAEKLQALADRVWEVAHQLAEAWSSEESVQCQEALRRIEQTARHLSTRSYQMHDFTNHSAEVIEQAVNNFSTDGGPGFFQTAGQGAGQVLYGTGGAMVLGTVGGWVDSGLGALGIGGGPSKDEVAQQHLGALNQAYSEVNPLLPAQVSVELPVLNPGNREDLVAPPGGYAPAGFGGGAGGAGIGGVGGAHLPAPDGVPGVPGVPPTGGFPAEDGVPDGYEWDGSTGGLAGATPLAPPTPGVGGIGGGGGVPGVPPGPGAGGLPGPGAAGAAVPPGGIVPMGATGGRAGGGAGAPGSRGLPGAGRPGVAAGAVGRGGVAGGVVPMGAGAAGGGGRGGAAARPGGAGGAVGRGGVAGGMVPMGAGARGSGQDGAGRDTWLVEDEDPWGTDDGTPPSVIG